MLVCSHKSKQLSYKINTIAMVIGPVLNKKGGYYKQIRQMGNTIPVFYYPESCVLTSTIEFCAEAYPWGKFMFNSLIISFVITLY